MKIVAKTDKGIVRDNNQDAYAAGEFDDNATWAIVCDGMGGAAGGNIASSLAVKVISERIKTSYREHMRDSSICNMLESALFAANVEVYDMSRERKDLKGMGTTVVCVVVKNGQAFIAHVGDSRVYVIKNNIPTQITVDHSVVQNLIDSGQITEEEAEHHPYKNRITRAVGVSNDIDVDIDQIDLDEDDIILMCSDGLTNYVSKDEMIEIFNESKVYSYAEKLVKKANENGGGDNITTVILAN